MIGLPVIPPQAKLIAAAVLLALAFTAGWKVCAWRDVAKQDQAVADAIGAAAKQITADNQAAGVSAAAQDRVRVVYRTIHDEAANAHITDCRLGPDFMRVWNSASASAAAGPASGRHGSVP